MITFSWWQGQEGKEKAEEGFMEVVASEDLLLNLALKGFYR